MAAPVVYRLAPAFVVRLVGTAFVALALLAFVTTLVVVLADLPVAVVVVEAAVGVVALVGLGWWLRRRAWVLRCTDEGYAVRLARGAGVREARWSAVEDAVTTHRRGVACFELRLRDGRTTTVPVGLLDVDREEFVRDLQQRLQQGHGLTSLPGGPA
ncbi:hypothetical protein [Nocardioides flavescens]|uniref:PH domain-containing protein n=1 Tax=Nocardioides flavescens TaxID=2691959 RepID=A0A6L7EYR9_9ACTN|nr:hypothetical protein [Nocardioides flavescens]MXG88991.1 hypothetical protein [Nocardioides flavescens]